MMKTKHSGHRFDAASRARAQRPWRRVERVEAAE